ncbi:MAG: hypothetical protein [Olavius algarvensis Delta 4 endosymbiont]|nr:MAG: hypothetical protein [Olavius algarvensis Delta 4 endosymbiont]
MTRAFMRTFYIIQALKYLVLRAWSEIIGFAVKDRKVAQV